MIDRKLVAWPIAGIRPMVILSIREYDVRILISAWEEEGVEGYGSKTFLSEAACRSPAMLQLAVDDCVEMYKASCRQPVGPGTGRPH